jgi:hypothetical protein
MSYPWAPLLYVVVGEPAIPCAVALLSLRRKAEMSNPTPPATPTAGRLAEIRARLEKATPGPWLAHGDLVWSAEGKATICAVSEPRGSDVVRYVRLEFGKGYKEAFANADLIAHAPADIAYLLDALPLAVELARSIEDATTTTAIEFAHPDIVEKARALLAQVGEGE